jgi:aconitase A
MKVLCSFFASYNDISIIRSLVHQLCLGLLAKKALDYGLRIPSFTQTYLSPGSGVVTTYLRESGTLKFLEQLG